MFLALKEMQHNKLRFGLIIAMIMLISYLIFVLTALAYGLAQSNREAIDSWQAQSIALNTDANGSLTMSSLSEQQTKSLSAANNKTAKLGQLNVTTSRHGGHNKTSVQLLGVDSDEFIYRNLAIAEGKKQLGEDDAIAGVGLKTDGYKLGDKITAGSSGPTLTIVAFTPNASLSVSPVIYTSLDIWKTIKFGGESAVSPSGRTPAASAVVAQNGTFTNAPEGTQVLAISSFISLLPGYAAQNLTFSFMIVFLFIITLIIIGIFLYILTMQKIPSFAVLKVQGILTRYLIENTVVQGVIITVIGVTFGGVLTVATALAIPPSVPMSFNLPLLGGAAIMLLVMSVAGSLISVRTIARIDPISVMEGN